MKFSGIVFALFLLLLPAGLNAQQVTGLSGWNICLDPGHSGVENMGIYNYSEAEKNLGVGLNLRQILLSLTDIDTVYMTRTDSIQNVSLSQRTDYANSIGTAWFHSIHSDAGSASANSTLLLWGQYSNGLEKVPNGGKRMSDLMIDPLTRGMRTNTSRGSIGDCSFYGCTSSGPYLWVNRNTNMPSELSEAGFHTNPTQNQKNMNAEWKRLEAWTFSWSIIKYHNAARPAVRKITGIIKDAESGLPINGAKFTIDGKSYTTDTYQSLFYRFTSDSTLLRNGFYFIENLTPGTLSYTVTAPGYEPFNGQAAISDTFFTFVDVNLVSTIPPVLVNHIPIVNDSIYPGTDIIQLKFSRPMNKASVESNITLDPQANLTYAWTDNDRLLRINTSGLAYSTGYSLTIQGGATDIYNHPFDGDKNGVGGDPYTFNFRTKVLDTFAPVITSSSPVPGEKVLIKPVINVSFDEPLLTSSISGKFVVTKKSDNSTVNVFGKYYPFNKKSVVNLFVRDNLIYGETYKVLVKAGVSDVLGNAIPSDYSFEFTVNKNLNTFTTIDNFEAGIGDWWVPQQSGQTIGIVTDSVNIYSNGIFLNHLTNSTKSFEMSYGWDTLATEWMIREYYNKTSAAFDNTYILETFVFGDGNGHKFRFAINDNGPGGHEVSEWKTVDWIGWKSVIWDLANDPVGTWIGNGVLEGSLTFDSYQFTYTPGKQFFGRYYIDDLRFGKEISTSADDEVMAAKGFYLNQNYPNPFNPETVIRFGIPSEGEVSLKVFNATGELVRSLVNGQMRAGEYEVKFNAVNLNSGVYFYVVENEGRKLTGKMILLK